MNAVDTNVLLYSIDKHEPTKQLKAQKLLLQLRSAKDPTFIPWQVLAEVVQQLRRWRDLGKLTGAEFQQHVQAFRNLFPILMPAPAVLDKALDLANRFSLSHWDSMILGACVDGGITMLYTEDIGAPRTVDTVQLINPF